MHAACNPTQILRDDVLVVVNDNSKSSPEVGDYYCEKRGINPGNVVHVRVPVTNDVELDQFISLRDQIIYHIQEKIMKPSGITPVVCDVNQGFTRYYCPESTEQIRVNSGIRYLVTTKGIPIRFNFTGSSVAHNPEASIDNYLRFWLTNYFSADVNFTINNRAFDFADGRGMREVDPINDLELIVGRIDGIDTDSAKRLVDRAITAETMGIFGKLYGDKFSGFGTNWKSWPPDGGIESVYPSANYLHGIFGELVGLNDPATNPAVRHTSNQDCLNYDANGKIPKQCVAAIKPGSGSEPTPGTPGGKIPFPDNALVHQSNQGTFSLLNNFEDLLNWRDSPNCNTLCNNNDLVCKNASSDTYKELDTRCVRVADGHIGYFHKSYPVGMMASWPTGWFQSTNKVNDKFNRTGSQHYYFWQPEVRDDTGFDDNYSLWYRNDDELPSSNCFTGTENYQSNANSNCNVEKKINLNQIIELPQRVINLADPQKVTIKFKYRAININKNVSLSARILVREVADNISNLDANNQVVYDKQEIKNLTFPNDPLNSNSWGNAEVTFTLNPILHKHPQKLYDAIKIRINIEDKFEGEFAVDDFSVTEDGVNIPLINSSFDDGHKQLSGGDTAATFLSRLNGAAFWGNISHHEGNGRSFNSHPLETLIYFFRGLPLGDAVWFAETHNSGILYGDPLYSPIAVHLNYLKARDIWAPDDQFSTLHDSPLILTGHTQNGTDLGITTTYSVDYCEGEDDFLVCDTDGKWIPIGGLQNFPGGQRNMSIGNWDITNLSEGDYVLRLAVTSNNPSKGLSGLTQTFYDYYPINLYTPGIDDDDDGLSYEEELAAGTDPRNKDTDNDGLLDKEEIDLGLDPVVANTNSDSDGDGVSDFIESLRGTDPTDASDTPIISTLLVDQVNGSDNNQSPFKTLDAALNAALAGDKILLSTGVYNTSVIDFFVPIKLQGPPDNSAIFPTTNFLWNRTVGTIIITNLTFSYNNLFIYGDVSGNGWQFHHNIFNTNTTINDGSDSTVAFTNNIFSNASENAIKISEGSIAILKNNTITDNNVGVRVNSGSELLITNSIISGNHNADLVGVSPNSVSYTLTGDAFIASTNGNIIGDPLFVDPQNGDFHLKPESPAIDAGDPQSDFSLEPESAVGRVNMGAYGNTAEATIAAPKSGSGNSSGSSSLDWLLLIWLTAYGIWRTRGSLQTTSIFNS